MGKLQIPIYDAVIDEEGLGLFGISYVDNPAICVDMIAFSEKNKILLSDMEKHEIVSPLMIPDQLIYRETPDGLPYYMRMSKETIRLAAQKYLMEGHINDWTYQHENLDNPMETRRLDDIYLKRMWIVETDDDDAMVKYGFDVPFGTLMVHAKVLNESLWGQIRAGEIRGLSLEAMFKMRKMDEEVEINYRKMDKFDYSEKQLSLFQRFVAFLNEVSDTAEAIKTEAQKDETNSGEVELKYYIDDQHYFIVDGEGFVRNENYELVQEGNYMLSDGNILKVNVDCKFDGTVAVPDEKENIEAPIEEEALKKIEEEIERIEDEKTVGEVGEGANEINLVDFVADDADRDKEEEKDVINLAEVTVEDNTIPYVINGVEFSLDKDVVDYIESLKKNEMELTESLSKLKDEIPSAQPVGTVVKTSEDAGVDINSRIALLNRFGKRNF